MKKNYLFLLSLLLLAGCNNKNESVKDSTDTSFDVSIISPTGAPALAFYNYQNSDKYETNATPKNILATMTENGKDIVVIDTISGLKAIDNGAPYKIAASLTFGNFYLASTGNDDNNALDKDDKVIVFGENQTPDLLFKYLYGTDYNVSYVDSVATAAKTLISGKTIDTKEDVDYVFVAEPVLTNALKNNQNAKVYANIQDLYKEKTNGKELVQASLFVKNTTNEKGYKNFLSSLKKDVEDVIANSELMTTNDEEAFTSKYGIASSLARVTIAKNNAIGLGFKYALENKDNIANFCKLFNYELNEESILSI